MADTALTRQQVLNKAAGIANNRLKAAHTDEWNGYMTEETKNLGEDWSPKPTAEQKAKADLARLIQQYPDLAEKIKKNGISAVL